MEGKYCKTCTHFRQHYGLDRERIFRVFCGHCVLLRRVRKKNPDTVACDNYAPAQSREDAFATKEFLSKELLQYMMSLDLLPQIEDAVEI